MKLKTNQLCPIHSRIDCCGRTQATYSRRHSKWETVRPGVRRFWDESLKRFRWRFSDAEKKKILDRQLKISSRCRICGESIADYREATLDHIEPKGMGGARHDDGENGSNLQAAHKVCNLKKGSQRL